MSAQCRSSYATRAAGQRGQAMLLSVLLLGVGVSAIVFSFVTPAKTAIESDKKTAAALARARDALIGYAASNQGQPGILPCPDNDNDGSADAPCGALGVTAIGRLPWRTLGIEPLRDGAGECLWYAVSANFKTSGVSGPASVNPDSPGTLIVNDGNGTPVLIGANAALAIVFAPGPALPTQDRTPGAASICGGNNNASNYLDTYIVGAMNFNNATGGGTNNFVSAPPGAQYGLINDKLLPITSDALFNVVNVRVAKEAIAALEKYRGAPNNIGYYPYANPYGTGSPYSCSSGLYRGRFPTAPSGCGQADWPAGTLPAWFSANNWSQVTHYAISKGCGQLGLDPLVEGQLKTLCDLQGNM